MKIKKNILAIGKNSFLGNNFIIHAKSNDNLNVTPINYYDIPDSFEEYDWVINFAFNPLQNNVALDEFNNFDLKLIKLVKKNKRSKYVFLSSRKVYGSNKDLNTLNEKHIFEKSSISTYGKNKLEVEKTLINELDPSRFLISRGSNIFGLEYGRKTFFGIAQKSLSDFNEINLDTSKEVIKDFLPVNFYSLILETLINNNITGIFNIGSGIKISLDEICSSLIAGYGSGLIKEKTGYYDDQFILDISKLKKEVKIDITKENILSYTYELGSLLREKKDDYK